jgi:RNA polymerase sigma-70 factor (ECF subfamily)
LADSTLGFEIDLTAPEWEPAAAASVLSPADQLLLDGLRSGDEAAYEALIERFQHPVYSLVYRLMSDPADSGDVVQEVFLKVFRSVGSFRGQSSLKTWIYRIAVNEASNHRRWFSRRRGQEVGLDAEQPDGRTLNQVLPDPGPNPFELVVDQEMYSSIEAALQQIRPVFREAVVLRDVEGLSYEEIAEILRVSLGTVKSRILRGREALRECLAQQLLPASRQQERAGCLARSPNLCGLSPQGAD